jgi:hypothetical protein
VALTAEDAEEAVVVAVEDDVELLDLADARVTGAVWVTIRGGSTTGAMICVAVNVPT